MTTDRKPGPFDVEFENGYVPMDEPPGIEEREYRNWKAAGGKVINMPKPIPTPAEMMERLLELERRDAENRDSLRRMDAEEMRLFGMIPFIALGVIVFAILALTIKLLWGNVP